MYRTLRSFRFLFTAPLILAICFVVARMTSGDWFHWAALGIGIAWFFALLRVIQAIIVVGGLAAFMAWLSRRKPPAG